MSLNAIYNLSDNPDTRIPQGPGSKLYLLIVGDNPTPSTIDQNPLPDQITLSQNYPNPFNAQTTIEYALPGAEQVRIDVYDVLGRKVETLVDAFQEAGTHTVVWEGDEHMASGMYMYQLRTSHGLLSRTMIISR